jgi:beta-glucanase (GH16 family)
VPLRHSLSRLLVSSALAAIGAGAAFACGSSAPVRGAATTSGSDSSTGSTGTSPPAENDSGSVTTGSGDSSAPPQSAPDASTDEGTPSYEDAAIPGWTLTWSDEFNGPDGSAIDSTNWNQETGNGGWTSNKELEYYTPGTANAIVQDGSLVITASTAGASALKCGYGTCQYTSARFNTSGKFQQAYGLFEARIQIPLGQGLWPAFWTLGNNIGSVGWPQCGEIDIMENIGKTPSTNYGSMHGPGYSGSHDLTGSYSLPDGGVLGEAFHIYDIQWEPDTVSFYVDGNLYETRTPADVPAGDTWVYDHPFYVILNVAVGGSFPGNPTSTTVFPQTMKVDYVRVYSKG